VPLVVAVGAGAVAGTAFTAMQEREIQQREAALRAPDLRGQHNLLDQAAAIPALQAEAPVLALLVHLGRARLGKRLLAKRLKVVIKFGARGWSLLRESREVWSTDDGQGPSVDFNETFVFLMRRGIAPVLRARLVRCGRTGDRPLAKLEMPLETLPFHQDQLWKMISHSGGTAQLHGSLQLSIEVRDFSLQELYDRNLSVGCVEPKIHLGHVADRKQPLPPLLQGVQVEESREAAERRLREEQPHTETESEAESSEPSSSGTSSGSDADGRSACSRLFSTCAR